MLLESFPPTAGEFDSTARSLTQAQVDSTQQQSKAVLSQENPGDSVFSAMAEKKQNEKPNNQKQWIKL